MAYEVSLVPGNKLYEVEDDVFGWLQPSIDMTGGRFSRDSYARDIEEGRSHLWIVFDNETLNIDAAIVTSVEQYPHKTMLNWALVGGTNVEQWVEILHEKVDQFRKDIGCDGSESVGRAGWVRLLKPLGWDGGFRFVEYAPEEEDMQYVA